MRIFLIIFAVVATLIGLTFVSGRGGHESYDAKMFKPGPVLGLVKGLSEDALEGRAIGTDGSELAQDMIDKRMSALELMTIGTGYRHPFTFTRPATETKPEQTFSGVNLIGGIQGSSGSDRVIVLTAHYDHVGVQNHEIYNGADDNASGVATLMAIAERYTRKRVQPVHSLLLVATDGEEVDFVGAQALLEKPPMPVQSFAFNLNFDMIARADNGKLWASGANHTASLRPVLEAVATEAPLSLELGFDGSSPDQDDWTDQSDHHAFLEKGIPHLYLGVEDHPDYHQPTDDFEKIDQDTFLKSVDTAVMVFDAIDKNLEQILGLPPLTEEDAAE